MTIEQLQAMSNDELNKLAAKLRGATVSEDDYFIADGLRIIRTQRSGFVKISGVAIKPFPIKVEGNDARAETIAFCAAMLAI